MKSLKSKISISILYMFILILLVSATGIFFINRLSEKSKGTIVDNYSSVDYTMKMISSLDASHLLRLKQLQKEIIETNEVNSLKKDSAVIRENMLKEADMITEPGERENVNMLMTYYDDYLSAFEELNAKNFVSHNELDIFNRKYVLVKNKILDIYRLNISAIKRKSDSIQATADEVTRYMIAFTVFCTLIGLSLILTLPERIVIPLKKLTEKIKSISEKNYDQKLEVTSNDEIGELAASFNIMAERLKLYDAKQIDKLLFEQKRLEALVHNIEDGILFCDESRNIVLVNNTLIQLAGLKRSDLINHNIAHIASVNDFIREIYKVVQAKNTDDEQQFKPIRVALNGNELFFDIETEDIITYAESEKKQTFIGSLILLRNVTEYQNRDKAKTNMLATVSHELKTPLSSINLSLNLLEDKRMGELNADQRDTLNSLRQQSLRLSRVINELLDYSQIETGNIKLKFSRIKPDLILDIGITSLMMQISEKNIDIKTKMDDELPEIMADAEKLAFVFINILNNAIRFSAKKDVIEIELCRNGNEVLFSVKDNGPGISKENREKLFQKFTQLDNKSKQGWGLGLAISKDFIQAQGGRIWAESEPGKGSKFLFTMPVNK